MNTRWCNRCSQEKPLDEFPHAHGKKLDHGYTCKACCREKDRIRDKTPERVKKSKNWLKSERGKILYKKRQEKYKSKYKAWRMIKKLVEMGVMKKEPCAICGDKRSLGHHPDYSKPLEVVWLCQCHHSEVHRK